MASLLLLSSQTMGVAMHAYLSKSPLSVDEWDRQELLDRVDSDQIFFCELLVMFRDDGPVSLKSAEDCLQKGDLLGLSRAAHTIKGMLRNLAMHRAAELADALEKSAGESHLGDSEKNLAELKSSMEKILPAVESHLSGVHA
jgi:HPt (histidine-containing phosphotransfer) domain-containing protein